MVTNAATDHPTSRLLSRPYRALTIGAISLASMIAFEYLAVATAMPTIARELHGLSLYALAFGHRWLPAWWALSSGESGVTQPVPGVRFGRAWPGSSLDL